jgi:hypothetical protein
MYCARETHSPGSPCRIERARIDCFEGRRSTQRRVDMNWVAFVITKVTMVLGAHMFNARTSPMRNREHMAEWTLTTNDDTSYIVCTIVELPRHCIVLVFDDSHREVMLMSGGILPQSSTWSGNIRNVVAVVVACI